MQQCCSASDGWKLPAATWQDLLKHGVLSPQEVAEWLREMQLLPSDVVRCVLERDSSLAEVIMCNPNCSIDTLAEIIAAQPPVHNQEAFRAGGERAIAAELEQWRSGAS